MCDYVHIYMEKRSESKGEGEGETERGFECGKYVWISHVTL